MSVKLSKRAFDHAKSLVNEGRFVADERDDWSEHQPTAEQENEFIRRHGWAEFGKWHLGVDVSAKEETKGHYKFPYGEFRDVHRCGVISAESRAGEYKYLDIERAAHQLHEMIDEHAHGRSHAR